MRFYADLHLHSHYSRATAKNCDLGHLTLWARKKGLSLLGTGDFTHPGWNAELKTQLEPTGPGVFALTADLDRAIAKELPRTCQGQVRFVLSAEISTIYKKAGRTRKVHHVILAPDFASADRMIAALSKIGNLRSDGRPILGLDSRDLLEIVLSAGPDCYLIPAHIWTPWFSALGSASGFDAIDDCYGDLAPHIFAVETGLSSDPAMNWRVSQLDRFRLISSSDAHSPQMLGREACVFQTEVDYFSVKSALETGKGYLGTVEFFPEEGKYHLDGHRKCDIRFTPEESRLRGGCPVCGKKLTEGVMSRVEVLADRPAGCPPPATGGEVWSLIPLPEIIGELAGVGPKSKTVAETYEGVLSRVGPELSILSEIPLEDISASSSPLLGEAITRLRSGKVIREAGYDGEYGVIRLFEDDELGCATRGAWLFASARGARTTKPKGARISSREPTPTKKGTDSDCPAAAGSRSGNGLIQPPAPAPLPRGTKTVGEALLAALDPEQRQAAQAIDGAVVIAAGPGSGKTRTLTHRIAHLIADHGALPQQCLTVTFSRRAAAELGERLEQLLGGSPAPQVFTFHALGLTILQEKPQGVGLGAGFTVACEAEQIEVAADAFKLGDKKARQLIESISKWQRSGAPGEDGELSAASRRYRQALRARNAVDYDDLIALPVELLRSDSLFEQALQERFRWIAVDEYQDIDPVQYQLIGRLAARYGNLCAIGDPDQSIYGFRGSDPALFNRFLLDYPHAQQFYLTRNYRSGQTIVRAAAQLIAPQPRPRPAMLPVSDSPGKIVAHQARSERAEAEYVVQNIEMLLEGHSFFSIDSGRASSSSDRALSFNDFAVLYRTDAQAEAAVEALARSGIPFQKRSHRALRERPGVGPITRRLADMPGEGLIRDRLKAAAASIAENLGELSSQELQTARELLLPLAERSGDTLTRFLNWVSLESDVDTWDPRAERISLLTLHAAKGLEFRAVFILGCEQGLIPLSWPGEPPQALDEERRLFYVGMTRARDVLYLCHTHQRTWRGKRETFPRSSFLQDIDNTLMEQSTGTARTRPAEQLSLF
jgi:DNA helicase II / ATP-dependent DNA helicase PcrA